MTLSALVERLTVGPARVLGSAFDRLATLEPGSPADIVMFDPVTVAECASYADPHQFATGITQVIVNGETVFRDGEHTGILSGQTLRRQNDFVL